VDPSVEGAVPQDACSPVRLIPETTNKDFVNRVALGSATADPKRANDLSTARIKILVPPSPPSACGSSFNPVAHAAC
jgi:hypothetical protein